MLCLYESGSHDASYQTLCSASGMDPHHLITRMMEQDKLRTLMGCADNDVFETVKLMFDYKVEVKPGMDTDTQIAATNADLEEEVLAQLKDYCAVSNGADPSVHLGCRWLLCDGT